ncbi:MAG: lysophospholipid acyltransferase family protein [Leptospirales bacterium]
MKRILSVIFWVLWMIFFNIVTQVFSIILLLASFFIKNRRHLRIFVRIWGRIGIRMGFCTVEIKGKENMIDEPAMIACNHMSNLDVVVCEGYIPSYFLFLSKKEVFNVPIVGQLMRKLGHISIDRSRPKKAAMSLKKAIEIVKEGNQILIYPEGSRNPNPREMLPLKPGALLVARQGKVPIVPVILYGTSKILPVDKKFYFFPHKIIMNILPPIYPGDELHPATAETVKVEDEILEKLRLYLSKIYNEMADEMEKK